jgi:hypothetical protein
MSPLDRTSMSVSTIIYDIPSRLGQGCFPFSVIIFESRIGLKSRYAPNFKAVPYKTTQISTVQADRQLGSRGVVHVCRPEAVQPEVSILGNFVKEPIVDSYLRERGSEHGHPR